MSALPIDFAPRSFLRAYTRTSILFRLIFSAAVIVLISIGFIWRSLHQQYQLDASRLYYTEQQVTRRYAKSDSIKPLQVATTQAAAVNQAISQLNLPWREMWNQLEATTPSSIGLLALEPDTKRHRLHIQAEAKNSDAMLDYIMQLRRQPFFSEVMLQKHETNELDPEKPIRFQLDAFWSERAP
jgi:Tfp pilus assembly protein PilN